MSWPECATTHRPASASCRTTRRTATPAIPTSASAPRARAAAARNKRAACIAPETSTSARDLATQHLSTCLFAEEALFLFFSPSFYLPPFFRWRSLTTFFFRVNWLASQMSTMSMFSVLSDDNIFSSFF